MAHGAWRGALGGRYSRFGHPGFALVLKGPCWLSLEGVPAAILETGDFVFFPATPAFTLASDAKVKPKPMKSILSGQQVEELFHGDRTMETSASLLGGYFMFDPTNASLLLDLLPKMLHLRAADPEMDSLAPVVALIKREALEKRAGQILVLARLIEVLLVETLRSAPANLAPTGLLAGLREAPLAVTQRAIHTRTEHPWTLATLAREAGMSRSSFAERFARVIGMTPLNYLLQWRLSVAKDMLVTGQKTVAEITSEVGYESASGLSTAFSRETGQSPMQFVKTRGISPRHE
ncbi:MAG TPA: AraC family transcriptional regulator [Candidatus Limnocylindria bacterium]|jgi:AraC-like DNA-binding protein|nr:AraC family transcriptional regulator [Candidatus Limnocylindria bacterium]